MTRVWPDFFYGGQMSPLRLPEKHPLLPVMKQQNMWGVYYEECNCRHCQTVRGHAQVFWIAEELT